MHIPEKHKDDLQDLLSNASSTLRATSPDLEALLFEPIPILDHGFIRVVDYMGDDAAIVQAARVSYGKGTKKVSEDQGLINYLLRHRHTTPFEMCEIKFHVKMPIFVARQWLRHRTANVNEYSARYSVMDREFYIPAPDQIAAQSTSNNQGRDEVLTGRDAERVLDYLKHDALLTYKHYQEMMNFDDEGNIIDEARPSLARELARMNLPVNFYTQFYWKIDLHNFMHFLSLRADPHAQYEIRIYAEKMLDILKAWAPMTYHAFMEYKMGSTHLSKTATEIIKRRLKGESIDQKSSGLGAREWRELLDIFPEIGE
ncbi:MAG: FAD-dependent thymidylate synthase [Alphaproteobacteria bacterium]|nr:FAD-dependent thymidylate synthase [Alphaproteobacteria bacterium]